MNKFDLKNYLQSYCDRNKKIINDNSRTQIEEFEYRLKKQFKLKKNMANYPKIKLQKFSNQSLRN